MSKIDKQLNSIISTFQPLIDKDIVIDNNIKELKKFSEHLSDLEDFLENLEDMQIDNKTIQHKIDIALDLVVPLNCRIAGDMAEYELGALCK